MGASLFASIPLEYLLCSLGIHAVAIEAGELLHYRHQAYREAIVVVVSRSGESIEIARLLEILQGRQPIIGISNVPESLLARSSDVSIHVGSLPDEMVAIQTYTGSLLALHLLGSAVADCLAAAKESIETLLPKFGLLAEESMNDLARWDAFLSLDSPTYLLARGPSSASACEGALLFHEIAKSPAVAMATASFRHGPVEVVDRSFNGLVFAPEGNTRDLNVSLARDLVHFGGRVRLIGPMSGMDQDANWCVTPDVPEMLAPLFEILPIQAAVLRLAQLRGVSLDCFRYAPQVAVDEASFCR
jgi:glucosamine--fructose-6-phosphate aminotransferase (isomerizing)